MPRPDPPGSSPRVATTSAGESSPTSTIASANAMAIDDGPVDGAVDAVVIGGGINGTGVARDLALRGVRVVLYERNDLAFGASGNSSGMIHGGVRYLSTNPKVTREACQDSGYIQQIAPHLLFRIPLLMTIKAGPAGRLLLELVDAYFRAYDDFQPLKRGQPHTRLSIHDMQRLEPGLVADIAGGVAFDEWGVDGARLCVLNALDAEGHGAKTFVHTTVESIGRAPPDGGPPHYVVRARDRLTGRPVGHRARIVVNATGAWAPITASLGQLSASRVRVRPGKGIHVVYDRRISNYGVISETIDGRQVFVYPWENASVLGTTDDDYFGDLDSVAATSEEVRYLVQALARVLPSIRTARAIGTYAGVRPTLYEYGPNEDELSREHAIVDHEGDGAPGVYSMIGGKLASYRLFAQELGDKVAPIVAPGSRCTTHERPLPGGSKVPDAIALASRIETSPVAARRLVFRHGLTSARIAERIAREPKEAAIVCPCEPVLEAEIRHVVASEGARTVADVSRRTRLGLGSCGGMRCAARCAQIVGEELELHPRETLRQARRFLIERGRARVVAMGPEQARQEALGLAQLRATLGTRDE
jgi:glycerol-3-phosphate dehydrogenase